MNSVRDHIRSKVLGQQAKSNVVELEDGLKIEVRQTSVGSMLDSVAEEDLKKRMFRMIMLSCFVPGTDEPVFEDGDFESVMLMPSGGYYQKLMDAVNANTLEKKVEEAKKP